MALFGTKKTDAKKVTKKTVKTVEKAVAVRDTATSPVMHNVILRPRITEKSGIAHEVANIYTFEVEKNSTKRTIAESIRSLYKVTPLKVRTVNLPSKRVFVRGRFGAQSAVKKALVYLKKGDTIDIA